MLVEPVQHGIAKCVRGTAARVDRLSCGDIALLIFGVSALLVIMNGVCQMRNRWRYVFVRRVEERRAPPGA
jgi:hypothetical protein